MADFVRHELFTQSARGLFKCHICSPMSWMTREDAIKHEDGREHVSRVRELDSMRPCPSSPASVISHLRPSSPAQVEVRMRQDAANEPDPVPGPLPLSPIHGPALLDDDPFQIYDNWHGQLGVHEIEHESCDRDTGLDLDLCAESETAEQTPACHTDSDDFAPVDDDAPQFSDNLLLDLLASAGPEGDWFPFDAKAEGLFEVLTSFPRSMFSQSELAGVKWLLNRFGITGLPSTEKMRKVRDRIAEEYGAETNVVDGKCGNLFAYNSMAKIVRDEWANPLVRPHVQTYPELPGKRREHAYQGDKWVREVDATLAGPMARFQRQDYFVDEVAIAGLPGPTGREDVAPVLIKRFYTSPTVPDSAPSPPDQRIHALVERLSCDDGRLKPTGKSYTIPLSAFVASYPELAQNHEHHKVPHPDTLKGPNPWRSKANGRRVLAVPLFKYCDDTSGNVSKKWNKHNSLLFVLAGLPRERINLPYNIHFLATSNAASPLEMLESLAQEMRLGSEEGWVAWDCLYNEEVLLIPWALAFQGDNPMQSEISSHIGLTGKFFCRVCTVSRGDKSQKDGNVSAAQVDALEAQRLSDFMTCHAERTTASVFDELKSQLDAVLTDAAPSRIEKRMTETGVKDNYFLHFFRRLQEVCAEGKGQNLNPKALRALIAECRATMPSHLFNPAFSLPGLDPNRDTPVEVLHVILLGFVKYFWRDAVSRLNSDQKAELIARLDSVDTSGLGINRVQGRTLVQYAGSLVGRDFRTVLHVAPAVLAGLVSNEAYRAWLALCNLSALVFRPVVEDVDVYTPQLEAAIDAFLEATALWNYNWFNKPKFHIILHLPAHIRRFGPAPLYATETFESFNHIIRLRSIHSNRQAPSIDIAHAFSHMHAMRHILSGGFIQDDDVPGSPLRQAGDRVLALARDPQIIDFMSMNGVYSTSRRSTYRINHSEPACFWDEVQLPGPRPSEPAPCGNVARPALYRICSSLTLENGDTIRSGTFILHGRGSAAPTIARVVRILTQVQGSSQPTPVLCIANCVVGGLHATYQMPIVRTHSVLETIPATNALGAVGTFHDCVTHKCSITRTRVVVQERFKTASRKDEITHAGSQGDRVLNLSQLRNAAFLDRLRVQQMRSDAARRATIAHRALESYQTREVEKAAQVKRRAEKAAARAAKRQAPVADNSQAEASRPTKRPRKARNSEHSAPKQTNAARSPSVNGERTDRPPAGSATLQRPASMNTESARCSRDTMEGSSSIGNTNSAHPPAIAPRWQPPPTGPFHAAYHHAHYHYPYGWYVPHGHVLNQVGLSVAAQRDNELLEPARGHNHLHDSHAPGPSHWHAP